MKAVNELNVSCLLMYRCVCVCVDYRCVWPCSATWQCVTSTVSAAAVQSCPTIHGRQRPWITVTKCISLETPVDTDVKILKIFF